MTKSLRFLTALLISGCATTGIGSRSMESAIASHVTGLGKTLEQQYRSNLENIYTSIKAQHHYLEADFLPGGIGFFGKPVQSQGEPNTYLGIQLGTVMTFNTLQTDFNRRAATVFSRYGQELFNVAMAQKEVTNDPRIEGVIVALTWVARDFLQSQYFGGTGESISIFASKEDCKGFIEMKISNQEFLRRASIFGMQGDTNLGRIELDLKQAL